MNSIHFSYTDSVVPKIPNSHWFIIRGRKNILPIMMKDHFIHPPIMPSERHHTLPSISIPHLDQLVSAASYNEIDLNHHLLFLSGEVRHFLFFWGWSFSSGFLDRCESCSEGVHLFFLFEKFGGVLGFFTLVLSVLGVFSGVLFVFFGVLDCLGHFVCWSISFLN